MDGLTGDDLRHAKAFELSLRAARKSLTPAEREEARMAYEAHVASMTEDGLLMRTVSLIDVRSRHPAVEGTAGCHVGTGWAPILEDCLSALDGLHVRVTRIRESCMGLQVIVWPDEGGWRPGEIEAVGEATDRAWERSLSTCEACGVPGSRRDGGWGRGRIRCEAHADLP